MVERDTLEALRNEYAEKTATSREVWEENKKGLVDGVGSQPRYVEPHPMAVERASGSQIWDVDGNEYVDVFNCFGGVPMLGHAPDAVADELERRLEGGLVYGHPFSAQIEYTNALKDRFPTIERLRLANSGTEAMMNAIRLARSYTGRDKIVKMEGSYHGSADEVFVSTLPAVDEAGPADAPTAQPDGAGVPNGVVSDTLVAPFNDAAALETLLADHEDEVAAVILEPVALYGTLAKPLDGYLQQVRSLTNEHGAVFILDEVKTGCRIAYGGGCEYYDVHPDLVVLGKAISGGVPAGAFGGAAEIMQEMSFQESGHGRTENVGTYNANPLLVHSGLACLEELTPAVYERLEAFSARIGEAVGDVIEDEGITATVQHVPSLGYIHFGVDADVTDYRSASQQDFDAALAYWFAAVNEGILPPPKTGAWYLTASHTKADIDEIIEAKKAALAKIS